MTASRTAEYRFTILNTNPDSPYTRRGGSGGRVSPNNSGGACPTGDPCVLTGQYSRYRTSVNAYESTLAGFTGSQASSFGLVDFYKLPNNTLPIISGSTHYTFEPVVAQPLYITDVSVGGTSIDLLLVASLDDWLYAFNTSTGAEAWSAPLNLATADCGSSGAPFDNNIGHNPGGANLVYYGIVATPVIDIYTNTAPVPTAFVVAACVGPSNPSHIQWNLDAINLETGAEIGNVVIQSTGFNPSYQVSRASLLLTHPTTSTTDIYIAFGTGSGEVKAAAHVRPDSLHVITLDGFSSTRLHMSRLLQLRSVLLTRLPHPARPTRLFSHRSILDLTLQVPRMGHPELAVPTTKVTIGLLAREEYGCPRVGLRRQPRLVSMRRPATAHLLAPVQFPHSAL